MFFLKITKIKYLVRFYHLLRNISAAFHIPLFDFFRNNQIWVFHHIPKTAGSSITKMLNKRYMLVRETYYLKGIYKRDKINTKKLKNCNCLTGHFENPGFQIPDRYPEIFSDDRYNIFTFLRDPLKTQISLYYYKNPEPDKKHKLVDSIFSEQNYISNR